VSRGDEADRGRERRWRSLSKSHAKTLPKIIKRFAQPTMTALAATQSGCAVRCGPVRTVTPQWDRVIARSSSAYSIRVVTGDREHANTAVPEVGRISFATPTGSRHYTPYLFDVIKVGWPATADKRRVIRVREARQRFASCQQAALPACQWTARAITNWVMN